MKRWYLLNSPKSVSHSISKVDLRVWIDLSVCIGLAKSMAEDGQECAVIMFLTNLLQLYFQSKKKSDGGDCLWFWIEKEIDYVGDIGSFISLYGNTSFKANNTCTRELGL